MRRLRLKGNILLTCPKLCTLFCLLVLSFTCLFYGKCFEWMVLPEDKTSKRLARTEKITDVDTTKMFTPVKPTLPQFIPDFNDVTTYSDDVTLVTAYFNLGTFQKGELSDIKYTPAKYRQWMDNFRRIRNPVIAYFELGSDANYFRNVRINQNSTTVIKLVNRSELWSFSLYDDIAKIYSDPDYPKHHPNTVDPNYACTMHAKYELMYKSILLNPFRTKYLAWIDVGLFRELEAAVEPDFGLTIPDGFEHNKIAYSDVFRAFQSGLSDEQIFKGNFVWVCGCYFVGRIDTLLRWTVEYLHFVRHFINSGLMNSDQQVIFAAFSNYKPKSQLQTYFSDGSYNEWFYLAYLSKETWQKHNKQ